MYIFKRKIADISRQELCLCGEMLPEGAGANWTVDCWLM
jgi:hypothetical protein